MEFRWEKDISNLEKFLNLGDISELYNSPKENIRIADQMATGNQYRRRSGLNEIN